ncbi:nitroreductase family deazaflavin-dependent oxidoreductase [Microbacteriaceae bacterium VKM Ac-2855]|nr:nitroreductase family deazaflavin-dependent oxidoreductase [Microbacteriaceae bacterium VKM Ac-2855]
MDISTSGARSGEPRRIEIWIHRHNGRWFLTGTPGRARHWAANLRHNDRLIVHLKQDVVADVPAHAAEIADIDERTEILTGILDGLRAITGGRFSRGDVSTWVTDSPLFEVTFD